MVAEKMSINAVGSTIEKTASHLLDDSTISELAHEALGRLAPCWDLHDYVAVNPFFSLRKIPFLSAIALQQAATHSRLLPERQFFKEQYERGSIQTSDINFAIEQVRLNQPEGKEINLNHDAIVATLEKKPSIMSDEFWCFSDHHDQQNGGCLSRLITEDLSKWLTAYFDNGQAVIQFPFKAEKFFTAWRRLARLDQTLDRNGIPLTEVLKKLPLEPEAALRMMVRDVQKQARLDEQEWINYFHRLLSTTLGWASFGQHFEFEASRGGMKKANSHRGIGLEILAARMAYDLACFQVLQDKDSIADRLCLEEESQNENLLDYLWLLALERSFRKRLLEQFKPSSLLTAETKKRELSAQLVFCIDVRSEVIRRHIEKLNPDIETLGFAGFFGLPISIESLGNELAEQQCPVLLEPAYRVLESKLGQEKFLRKLIDQKQKIFTANNIRSNLNSCFSFVETLWPASLVKMMKAAFLTAPRSTNKLAIGHGSCEPPVKVYDLSAWSLETKTSIAHSVLKNMSVGDKIAPLVILFGHEGESVNNPHASSLDCGACCGHSGRANARVLSQLLNDDNVRAELAYQHNIQIPAETIFLPGVHNTTCGTLTIETPENPGADKLAHIRALEDSLLQAQRSARSETARNLPLIQQDRSLEIELQSRARDWSEVRPEWGLARNAAFIIGRRERTRSVDLWGRSFLHDYDASLDHDGSVLELILTAPMVVTNWINLQYYASTVAPKTYGAGDKTLHNVVGGIGVIEGYSGDLLTGLSRQSVHYGDKYFHEPIRLQVVVEASRERLNKIINKHQIVKDLVGNHWLNLISIDPDTDERSLFEAEGWLIL